MRGYDAAGMLQVALTIACVWPDKHRVVLALLMAPFGALNVLYNAKVLPKLGELRGEILRLVYNLGYSVPFFHFLGWPIAAFLWLPFMALFTNNIDRRAARAIVTMTCVVMGCAAVFDGVRPLVIATFAIAAVVARITVEATTGALMSLVDEAEAANARLREETAAREVAQRELENARKLEAIGRVAAGVAHEINTPVQYVGDNIDFARSATADILDVFKRGRALIFERGNLPPDVVAALERNEAEADVPFLLENLPGAMDGAREGLERIAKIVRSMKTFSHRGNGELVPLDINEIVESALTVAQSELRNVVTVETRFEIVPHVACRADEINQVFLNLIVNAAHACADRKSRDATAQSRITIHTHREAADVVVEIADTGGGIPESIRDKVMEPFFTTKPVGKGTGQGLAIARTLVEAHGGTLAFESKVGLGTTFRVRLPVVAEQAQTKAA